MTDLKRVFKGASTAKVTKKGQYLSKGQYVLRVRATTVISTNDGPDAFIMEGEVVESSEPIAHPIGTERSWFQGFKYRDSALGEIKKFAYAALGLDMTNIADKEKIEKLDGGMDAFLEKMVENNGVAGTVVRCECIERETKTGGTFTVHNFYPIKTAN